MLKKQQLSRGYQLKFIERHFKSETIFWTVFAMAFLAIFIRFQEPGLGNSSTLYGAIARNISETGKWFSPMLAPGFFDPFAEHPYLVLWLNAILLKIFGSTTQTLRLLSSFMGLLVFSSLFFSTRRILGEKIAVVSALMLVSVNVFMNFTSSGWLDMCMNGLVWLGVAFIIWGLEKKRFAYDLIGAFLFGLAVLAKGVCALATIPMAFFAFYHYFLEKKYFRILFFTLISLAPIVLFTYAHYVSEGYFFWHKYIMREVFEQTLDNPWTLSWIDKLWYLKRTLQFGHVVAILGFWGCSRLYKAGYKKWAVLIFSEYVIHALGYSWSTRHYAQYTTPVFPWLSIAAAYGVIDWVKKIPTLMLAKTGLRIVLVVFVAVEILPIRVHSGNENPYRSLLPTISQLKDNKTIYFIGEMKNQETWEDPVSYMVWFLRRTPKMTTIEEIYSTISVKDQKALGVISTPLHKKQSFDKYPALTVCAYNDLLTVIAAKNICPDEIRTWRYREPAKGGWEKTL